MEMSNILGMTYTIIVLFLSCMALNYVCILNQRSKTNIVEKENNND